MAELSDFSLHLGDPPPPFSLEGTDGRPHSPAEFASSPLLVVAFWCNHCPYVQAWEGRMIDLGRRFGPRGVSFVLINSNDATEYPADSFDRMKQRAQEKAYPFPYVRDESQDVARAYGALVTPHVFVFDPDRRLVYQGRIDDDHQAPDRVKQHYLESALEAGLAHRAVGPAETPVLGCSVKWRD
jgi:peroxiredoxin